MFSIRAFGLAWALAAAWVSCGWAANPSTAQWLGARNVGDQICYQSAAQGNPIAGAAGSGCHFAYLPSLTSFLAAGVAVDCSGVVDSSAQFALALAGTGGAFRIPGSCTVLIGRTNLPLVTTIVGDGESSVIKLKVSAGVNGGMLREANSASQIYLGNLTLDGNYQNNGGDNSTAPASLVLVAGGASASAPANLTLRDVTFVNGGGSDVELLYTNSAFPTRVVIEGVRHLGGMMGGSAGSFNGAVDATISDVQMDLQRAPSAGAANTGRAGYIFQAAQVGDTSTRSATLTNIQCHWMGKTTSNNLGCVDSYSAGDHFIVSNSFSKDAFGRGFTSKGSVKNLVFSNIVVTNLAGNADVAPLVSDCFAVYPAVAEAPSAGADVTMHGLQCLNSGYGGIEIEGPDVAGTSAIKQVVLDDFIIDGCDGLASGGHGLRIKDAINVTVGRGIITDCDTAPLVVLTDGTVTPGYLLITDNIIDSAVTAPTFDGNTRNGGKLWYARNVQGKAFTTGDLTLTLSGSTITAWNPLGYVDTSAANQTVDTIVGIPNGESFTLGQTSSGHTLNVNAGGTLALNGANYAARDVRTTITFGNLAGTLTEVGRSNASGLEFAGLAPTIGTGAGDCGTSPGVTSYSNNSAGRFTVGAGANGSKCTLTFGVTWSHPPMCSAANETTSTALVTSHSPGGNSVEFDGTFLAADNISYQCSGAQ